MKTILKVWLPLSAFALAGAGAGAINNRFSKEFTTMPLITGYINNGSGNCLPRQVNCTQVNTGQICMSSDIVPQQVFAKDAMNTCTIILYKDIH